MNLMKVLSIMVVCISEGNLHGNGIDFGVQSSWTLSHHQGHCIFPFSEAIITTKLLGIVRYSSRNVESLDGGNYQTMAILIIQ